MLSSSTLPPAPTSDSTPPNPSTPDDRTTGAIPKGITVIPDGRGSVYMRPLTPEEEAALPKRPYNAGSLTYVQDPMRYRPTFESRGRYEPLARPFDNLVDAQRLCERALLAQHPDAQIRWAPIDEPTTSWAMEVCTAESDSFTELGYRVTLLGSDFDYGPNRW
ncbi:hypothetical protein ACFCZ6_14040 [Streptomyces hydrogenans]|uniref:hypothetical protein n=1 Tax=Streptomyces hydrogenans TaxID=1873719 RepID=UPI0035DA4C8C